MDGPQGTLPSGYVNSLPLKMVHRNRLKIVIFHSYVSLPEGYRETPTERKQCFFLAFADLCVVIVALDRAGSTMPYLDPWFGIVSILAENLGS